MNQPMVQPIPVLDAQGCLRDLIRAAMHGQAVFIDSEGEELVQLVPVKEIEKPHAFRAPGKYIAPEAFEDDLLSDFEDYR